MASVTGAITTFTRGGSVQTVFNQDEQVMVQLVLTNSGTTPISVTSIQPRIQSTPLTSTPAALPAYSGNALIPASLLLIPASNGTLTYNYTDSFHGPFLKGGEANDLTPNLTAVAISTTTQVGNLVTVTTTGAHGFSTIVPGPGLGLVVNISGNTISGSVPIPPAGYNGIYSIVGVPSTTTFTYNQPTANQAAGANGTCQLMGGWVYALDAFVTFSDGTFLYTTPSNVTVLARPF